MPLMAGQTVTENSVVETDLFETKWLYSRSKEPPTDSYHIEGLWYIIYPPTLTDLVFLLASMQI